MNDQSGFRRRRPSARPSSPNFSSGPCKKHPGWDISRLSTTLLGRSHRSRSGKLRLAGAITRSCQLLGVPDDWVVGIVPGSATGAIEFALWNLLGQRDVDVIVSDGFSAYWADDIAGLMGHRARVHKGTGRGFPPTSDVRDENDVVLVYNGTGNGVCVKDLDWVTNGRDGLVIADAASAAFAMPLDFTKLDAVTWSWQKGLGSEAGHGMIAFGPRALNRATSNISKSIRPKLLNFCKADGGALHNLFEGHTISTPSLLALEDLHSALDWAEGIGGLPALLQRVQLNYMVVDDWVKETSWIDWLADENSRSSVSLCLQLVQPFERKEAERVCKSMIEMLQIEGVAYDIFTMHDAPAGFRIWGGPTVEADDLQHLTQWLEWAYAATMRKGLHSPEAKPMPNGIPVIEMWATSDASLTNSRGSLNGHT
ncbi:PLP-dependent aminotransferase family protein [Neorhizobium alkalisoli]|uniref:phosphoserine aminotransferase n=1 Tax=Neorhizobium alkalisoli TaxID=528178 RepID=UPI00197C80A4|nr:phosphoserine aminotransferase [Neorhizobium alkalisoli]